MLKTCAIPDNAVERGLEAAVGPSLQKKKNMPTAFESSKKLWPVLYIVTAYIVTACIVMVYVVVACMVMAYIVMSYIVIAYMLMA